MQKYLFLIFTVITVAVNGLATTVNLNGLTTKAISDNVFPTPITPAGFAFAIWGLIYTVLLIIGILIATERYSISKSTLRLYIASSVANCLWIFAWQYLVPVVPAVLLFTLLFLNYGVTRGLTGAVKHGYAVYLGWIVIASILNATVLLRYNLGITSIGIDVYTVVSALLVIGVFIYGILSLKIKSFSPILVAIWAYFGLYSITPSPVVKTTIIVCWFALAFATLPIINNYRIRKTLSSN
jgi:translocator protein